jgi:hypothetical protein
VSGRELPSWLAHLEEEDLQYIKRFVLASGSLKQLADSYGVSYPTIRLRHDRLIDRIKALADVPAADAFHAKVRVLVADGDVPAKLGKELLQLHQQAMKGARK